MALSDNDLKIVVGAQLSTEEAKKTLNNFVKTSSQTKVVFNTEVDESGFKRVEKVYKTINKYINEQGTLLETVTHQRKLANGQLSAENGIISKVVEGYKKMSSTTKEVINATESLNNKYNEQIKEITSLEKAQKKYNEELNKTVLYDEKKKYKDKYGNVVEENVKRYASGESVMKRIYEYEDEAGRKIQATTTFLKEQNGQWQLIGSTSLKVLDDQIKRTEQAKNEAEKYNATLKNVYKYKFNGKEVTLETKTLPSGEQIRTITREYEECGKKITEVSQQTKKLGEEWSKEHLISKDSIKDEVANLSQLENKLEEVNRFKMKGVDTTKFHIIDASGVESVKTVQRYVDELGNSVEATTLQVKQSDGTWKTYDTTLKKTNDSIEKTEKKEKELADSIQKEKEKREKLNKTIIDTTTKNSSYKKVIDGVVHNIKTISTTTKQYDGTLKTTEKTIDSFKDSQGRLVTTTKELKNGLETTNTVIEDTDKKARRLGQTFGNIVVKVTKFYLASLPVRVVQTAITETIQSVKEFDSALTEFKKVSDLSGKALDDYTLKLEKLGELTARTRTEMVQMATEFKRSGYSDEDAAKLARVASLYQNIADEELSASDASAVLISQMKAFQKQGLKAEEVIDGINEV